MKDDLKNRIITKYYPKCNDMFRSNLLDMISEYEILNQKTAVKGTNLSNDSSPMNTFGRDNY